MEPRRRGHNLAMQPVHFVWLGPNPGVKAWGTPNAVARACHSDNVRFWCLDQHANSFRQDLHQNVQLKTLNHLEQKNLKIGGRWKEKALDVLQTMLGYNIFVAAKDLLNLILLHTYGGYTFDTTTSVASTRDLMITAAKLGVKHCSVDQAVAKKHRGPHVVRVGKEGDLIAHQPGLLTVKTILDGYDPRNAMPILDIPQVDVWSMYSPAGHEGMAEAIRSYVNRCEVLGINSSNTPTNSEGVSGHASLEAFAAPGDQDALSEAKARRNSLIGRLISHSVLDGLIESYGPNPDTIEANTFRATLHRAEDQVIEQLPQDIVPELGLIKTYNGTWRA